MISLFFIRKIAKIMKKAIITNFYLTYELNLHNNLGAEPRVQKGEINR